MTEQRSGTACHFTRPIILLEDITTCVFSSKISCFQILQNALISAAFTICRQVSFLFTRHFFSPQMHFTVTLAATTFQRHVYDNSSQQPGGKNSHHLAGPTAVGKTSAAIRLAQQFDTAIISADSRQCFRELNIGVAKPTAEQLSAVPHYFINSHSVHEGVNAATFEAYALQACQEILTQTNIAIMAGGTGLYIKAFCEGLDDIPTVPEDIRHRIQQRYQQEGIAFLQQELQQRDAAFWEQAEQQNPQRLMRRLRSAGNHRAIHFILPEKSNGQTTIPHHQNRAPSAQNGTL